MRYARVTVRPDQLGGAPCIRGLRIPVATVVGMVADGMDEAEIIAAYPDLEAEDIRGTNFGISCRTPQTDLAL